MRSPALLTSFQVTVQTSSSPEDHLQADIGDAIEASSTASDAIGDAATPLVVAIHEDLNKDAIATPMASKAQSAVESIKAGSPAGTHRALPEHSPVAHSSTIVEQADLAVAFESQQSTQQQGKSWKLPKSRA